MSEMLILRAPAENLRLAERDEERHCCERKFLLVLAWAMKAIVALMGAFWLASPMTNATAADITIWPPDKNGRIFLDVSGEIAVGDEKTFAAKTANLDADHTFVSLVSDGGSSIAGGTIGDIIRVRGMSTYVGPNATCTSICAFIWLAGRTKYAANSSHIGFHGAYKIHTLQPSNEMNILLAVYLAQLGYNYDDVLWMLLPPPGNMHWLTPETTQEHHVYWAELSPTRDGMYDYHPPAPSPTVASSPKNRTVAHYTASENLNLRSGPRGDMPSALAKDEYIPAGTTILAWQDESCRQREGSVKPYGPKDFWCPVYYKNPSEQVTKGWVNAYYLLTLDGVRLGERFALNQENDGAGATMRWR